MKYKKFFLKSLIPAILARWARENACKVPSFVKMQFVSFISSLFNTLDL